MKKLLLILGAVMCFFTQSQAVTKTWVGASGGVYSTGTNWSPTGAPSNLDDVVFDGFVGTVTIDGTFSPNSMAVKNSANVLFTSTATRTYSLSSSAGAISSIDATSTLTVGSTFTINLSVISSSIFNVNGSLIFTGAASSKLDCQGGVTTINGTLKYTGGSNTTIGSLTSYLVLANNSIYEIAKNGGSVPNATYQPNSLLKITGNTSSFVSINSSVTSYGNIEINNTTQSAAGSFSVSFTCNNLTFTSSNNFEIRLLSSSTVYGITTNGDLNVGAASIFNLSNGTANGIVKVKGNVNITGTLMEGGTSTGSGLELIGTTEQTISVTGAGNIANDVGLRMNSGAGGSAKLLTNVNLPSGTSSKLTFTAGLINGNGKTLTVANIATTAIVGGSPTTHFYNGKILRKTNNTGLAHVVPVGDGTSFFPVKIYPAAALATDFLVEFIRPTALSRTGPATAPVVANYHWDISVPTGTPSADLSFGWQGASSSETMITDYTLVKGVHHNGSSWDDLGGTASTGPGGTGPSNTVGYLDVFGVTAFSPFSVAGVATAILPTRLVNFAALKNTKEVDLTFRTASESQNSHFLIERSANGKDFSDIGRVEGHGTTQTVHNYEFTDKTPLKGTNYYRLKQVDFDGRFEFSKIVSVYFGEKNLDVNVSSATNDLIRLAVFSQNEDDATIAIVDMNGRIVSTQKVVLQEKNNNIDLNTTLQNGMYVVKITTTSGEQASKIMSVK